MPIVLAPLNEEVTITRVAITDEKTKKHLQSLGIVEKAKVSVISSSMGSVVVQVQNGRLALDRNIATHIFIA